MKPDLNLDQYAPDRVAHVLRKAADAYREAPAELSAAWQDENAGKVWGELAKILDRAADQAQKACKKYGL